MIDPFQVIEEGCYLMFRFGLRASTTITGNLITSEDRCYLVAVAEASSYHPLEAALHCQDIISGDWKADVATRLGVSAAWIEGFIDGFGRASEASPDPEYVQGFLTAEELRQRCPSLLGLPGAD